MTPTPRTNAVELVVPTVLPGLEVRGHACLLKKTLQALVDRTSMRVERGWGVSTGGRGLSSGSERLSKGSGRLQVREITSTEPVAKEFFPSVSPFEPPNRLPDCSNSLISGARKLPVPLAKPPNPFDKVPAPFDKPRSPFDKGFESLFQWAGVTLDFQSRVNPSLSLRRGTSFGPRA